MGKRGRHLSRGHGGYHYLLLVSLGVLAGFGLGIWTRSTLIPCDLEGDWQHYAEKASHGQGNSRPLVDTKLAGPDPSLLVNRTTKGLVLIGVMTAKKYLNTRVVTAYNTWARDIPGKVLFFSSEGSESVSPPGLPVIGLTGVDDSYPPQKKSFMMIKYMHDHFIGQFEFFMRADDDVFIRGDKLSEFLHSINSTKTLFIGQAGQGNREEIGLLNLQGEENFCMGGPSMVMSKSTMAKMVPNVSYCLKNLYSTHEDVEIGRCVRKFAGVRCTWAFEMQRLFLNNYKEPNGSFAHSLHTREANHAITLHPVKNHTYQYRIYHHFYMKKAMALRQEEVNLHREIHAVNEILQDRDAFYSPNRLGLPPSLLKSVPKAHDDVLAWDFINTYIFSLKSANPRRGLDQSLRKGLEDVVMQSMEVINKNARQRGRTIDFQKILYGYHRVNPLHGSDYVLDLLLVYRKHKGKRRMTVPVRRHAYLQQTFTAIEFEEMISHSNVPASKNDSPLSPEPTKSVPILDMLQKGIGQFYGAKENSPLLKKSTIQRQHSPVVHFILPLAGRFQTFLQFMHNFEEVCLQQTEKVVLAVMLFHSDHEDRSEDTVDFVQSFQRKYPHHDLRVVQVDGVFSRGVGLMEGSNLFTGNTLLFFIDVDIYLRRDVLHRIKNNVQQGTQVYYPIVFSQYDPAMICEEDTNCPDGNSPFKFNNNKGYWRQFGFGIAAMYKSDLVAVGGFDTAIQGWGKEDVDLYSRFLAKNITVFRSVDPGMVHIFHPVMCDPQLDSSQYQMCLGSKAATFGSTARLAQLVYKTPDILYKNEIEPEESLDQDDGAPLEGNGGADNNMGQPDQNINLDHLV